MITRGPPTTCGPATGRRGQFNTCPWECWCRKELGGSEAAAARLREHSRPALATSPATFTPGFLGPDYAPLIVGNQANFNRLMPDLDKVFRVQDLKPSSEIKQNRVDARVELLKGFHEDFVARHPSVPTLSHQAAYDRRSPDAHTSGQGI